MHLTLITSLKTTGKNVINCSNPTGGNSKRRLFNELCGLLLTLPGIDIGARRELVDTLGQLPHPPRRTHPQFEICSKPSALFDACSFAPPLPLPPRIPAGAHDYLPIVHKLLTSKRQCMGAASQHGGEGTSELFSQQSSQVNTAIIISHRRHRRHKRTSHYQSTSRLQTRVRTHLTHN